MAPSRTFLSAAATPASARVRDSIESVRARAATLAGSGRVSSTAISCSLSCSPCRAECPLERSVDGEQKVCQDRATECPGTGLAGNTLFTKQVEEERRMDRTKARRNDEVSLLLQSIAKLLAMQ